MTSEPNSASQCHAREEHEDTAATDELLERLT